MCKESVPAKKEGYGEDVREMEFAPMFGLSTQNQCINLHKVLCTPFILSMMYLYDNWSLPAQLYLFAHGTYSIMWLVKYAAFPPKNFEQKVPLSEVPVLMTVLSVYWLTPYVLCKNTREISPLLMMAALVIYQAGIFLHYVGDCQLHFTLLYKGPSLVDSGMYARTRNPGYLGK
jgi:steroid 5-alpha reductase family enzyme